jgi:hypothetical protein
VFDFLKNLFGGGGDDDRHGYIIYVRPKMCDEILPVRIDMRNDLSVNDNGDGYHVRKMVSGARCPFQAEILLYFDNRRNLTERIVENGEFATANEYHAAQETPID